MIACRKTGQLSGLRPLVGDPAAFDSFLEAASIRFPYALAIAAGIIFGALAAIIPARQAARMNVVAALRYE